LRRSRPVALGIALAASLGPAAVSVPAHAATLKGQSITFGANTCAPHWHAPNPGKAHFAVHNTSKHTATVLFFDAATNKVIAKVTNLHAHHSAELVATVHAGRSYLWGCDLKGGVRHTSEPEKVPRDPTHGGAGPYVPPIQTSQVLPALRKYRTYVHHRISALLPAVIHLHTLLTAHNVAGAKATWLSAHLIWLRIGQDDSAYGVFGDLGQRIDGTAAGHPRGVRDAKFTGFHRLEHDLWARHDVAAATKDAANLEQAVRQLSHVSLKKAITSDAGGASTFILRSHEIVEDAVRDTLSGDDEYGSGTALVSVTADIAATREVLGLLAPLIKPRSPGRVTKARRDLTRLATAAKSGHRTSIAHLSRSKRQHIDAAAGIADEELAPIPDLLRIGST
jgi:high-affinity iron transporter